MTNRIPVWAPDSFTVSDIVNGTGSDYVGKQPFPYGTGFVILANALADAATNGVGYFNILFTGDAATTDVWAADDQLFWDETALKLTDDGNGNRPIGRAYAAKANGDTTATVFIGDPRPSTTPIQHYTAAAALTQADHGKICTSLGAGGAVTLTLPQDVPAGVEYRFRVMAAQELRIAPGAAGAIYYDIAGTYAKQTDNKYATANALGERIDLVSDGNGDWIGANQAGTWTEET